MSEQQGLTFPSMTFDGKSATQSTSKPIGTTTFFTSEGDDISDPTKVGGGTKMQLIHNTGDAMNQIVDVDFNIKENESYVHEGYIIWKNANFDQVSLSIIPKTTPIDSPSINTNYNLYGGKIIIPAAGNGTIVVDPANFQLVEMPINAVTGVRPPAFWNADYDNQTHAFSNVTPTAGDGVYNMYAVDDPIAVVVNKVMLLDSGWQQMQTSDSMKLGHNMRLRLSLHTQGDDHDWKAACILTLHRVRTV